MNNTYFVSSYISRGVAFFIDMCILFFVYIFLVGSHAGDFLRDGEIHLSFFEAFVWIFIPVLYDFLCVLFFHRSLGKAMLGLWVVQSPHAPEIGGVVPHHAHLDWRSSLLRALVNRLSLFLGLLPQAVALLRYDRRSLADLVSDTYVVQLRQSPVGTLHPLWFVVLSLVTVKMSLGFTGNVLSLTEIENNSVLIRPIWDVSQELSDYEDDFVE